MRFYRDWYRPNLMAVIVVGDVDRDAVVAMIKSHFSSLTNPAPERPRPAFDVPEQPGTRYADRHRQGDRPRRRSRSATCGRRAIRGRSAAIATIMLDQLFARDARHRLDELSQRENPPFLSAAADRSLFPTPRTKDEASLQALVANDGVARGLEALVTELQRVARFGFTATELDAREAGEDGSATSARSTESPDRESASRADEYTRNFLQGEALPTIWQELAFHRRFDAGDHASPRSTR